MNYSYKHRSITAVVMLFVVLATGCQSATEEKQTIAAPINENLVTLTDKQLAQVKIETGTMGEETVATVLKLNGSIDVPPRSLVSVAIPLGGFLKQTSLLPGAYVSRGQVMATMQDEQYVQLQEDYLTTKASLSFSQADFHRQRELNKDKASSDKQYQQARKAYETDQVRLQSLAEKLRLININPNALNSGRVSSTVPLYAPISGYVYKVKANVGSYVSSSSSIFELINTNDIHLNLKVFEKDLNNLKVGQRVIAYTNENPDMKYYCNIILISHALNEDKSAEVHCHFENYDERLKPGMYMNAEIDVAAHLSNVVPEDAVVQYEGKQFVFVALDKYRFELTPVNTVEAHGNWVALYKADALKGKTIVLKNAYTLLMALKNKAEEE